MVRKLLPAGVTTPNWWWHKARRGALIPWLMARRGALGALQRRLKTKIELKPSEADDERVYHCIRALNPGGAERQLTYLSTAAVARGLDHRVLTLDPLEGPRGHYLPWLRESGVRVQPCPGEWAQRTARFRALEAEFGGLLAELPFYLKPSLRYLAAFVDHRPTVAHCWLDHESIWAGLAALLAGVPRIVLATRSLNPTHFYWHEPWFAAWYPFLLSFPQVSMLNNSHAGADDYARWLRRPRGSIKVVLNGLDFEKAMPAWHPEAGRAFRQELGIRDDAPLMTGVMRMSPQKRPDFFLEVALGALEGHPELHVAMVGTGVMEKQLLRRIERSPHSGRVHYLGHRGDVPGILAASDLLLLTSEIEGTPNVLIEAQHQRCVPISTRAGGAVDTLKDGKTGLLCALDDPKDMLRAIERLLKDPEERQRMAQAGQRFVRERFGLARMVDETLAIYPMVDLPPQQTPDNSIKTGPADFNR